MKRDYYIFNNGTIKRKDNSLQFIPVDGEKKYIPINDVDTIFVFLK